MSRLSTIGRCAVLALSTVALPGVGRSQQSEPDIGLFFAAASIDPAEARAAQAEIGASWRDGYASLFVDLLDILSRTGFVDPRGFVQVARLAPCVLVRLVRPVSRNRADPVRRPFKPERGQPEWV